MSLAWDDAWCLKLEQLVRGPAANADDGGGPSFLDLLGLRDVALFSVSPTGELTAIGVASAQGQPTAVMQWVRESELPAGALPVRTDVDQRQRTLGYLVPLSQVALSALDTRVHGRLRLLLELVRRAELERNLSRARRAAREIADPQRISGYQSLRDLLDYLAGVIASELATYALQLYLRRPYLPKDTPSRQWRNRRFGYALRSSAWHADAGDEDGWCALWDDHAEPILNGGPSVLRVAPPGLWPFSADQGARCRNSTWALTVQERAGQIPAVAEDHAVLYRYYGALSVVEVGDWGLTRQEEELFAAFADDLADVVHDCEVLHRLNLNDRLLFRLGMSYRPEQLFAVAQEVLGALYWPTEFVVLRREGEYLDLVHWQGIDPLDVPELNIQQERGRVVLVARTGRTDYVRDTEASPTYLPVNVETKSQIAVPMFHGEDVAGVLLLGFPLPDALGPADRSLIEGIASRLAGALAQVDQLRAMRAINSRWRKQLSLVRQHLIGFSRQDWSKEDTQELTRVLGLIEDWQRSMERLSYAMGDGMWEEDEGDSEGHLDLRTCVASVCRALSARAEEVGMRLVVQDRAGPEPIRVARRGGGLARALEAVIQNALDAQALTGTGRVVLTIARSDQQFRLSDRPAQRAILRVADDGPGIPNALRPKIFDPLSTRRAHVGPPRQDAGLGLFVARGIVDGLGGRLELRTDRQPGEPRSGAVFEFDLPLAAG